METFPRYWPLCGKFTGHQGDRWIWFPAQRPVTRSFDIFFDLRLNKRLSKQSRRRRFETPSLSLWRHCNTSNGTLCYVPHSDGVPIDLHPDLAAIEAKNCMACTWFIYNSVTGPYINTNVNCLWPYYNNIYNFCAVFQWWRHQTETSSALLAICAGNSPVTGEFPAKASDAELWCFL